MKLLQGKSTKLFTVLILTVFCLGVVFPYPCQADSIESTYHKLKSQYPEYVQRIKDGGATEAQIEAVLNDLDEQVKRQGTLTEANFNSVMFNSLKEVLSWRVHRPVFIAMLQSFGEEINYTLEKGELHPSLLPLRNAACEALLDSSRPGSSGGAASKDVKGSADSSLENQLNSSKDYVSLSLDKYSKGLSISGSLLSQLASRNKAIQIESPAVTLRVPAQAITLADNKILTIEVRTLEANATKKLAEKLNQEQKIISPVYDLIAFTPSTVKGLDFDRPVTVTISYQGIDLGEIPEDSLDAYYYNEKNNRWDARQGKLDKVNQTVTFTTTHFSVYALIGKVKPAQTGAATPDVPADIPGASANFTDITGHWAEKDINTMVSLKLVSGISATQFAPDRQVTRAEFAALLVRALNIPATGQVQGKFTDVSSQQWYFAAVNAAAQAGIVSGYSASQFAPDEKITREQMAVMMGRALAYKGITVTIDSASIDSTLAAFTDQAGISAWAREGVAQAVNKNIVKGRDQGRFDPGANATRAEAAAMILRLYNQVK
ncbi:S-layer homology domain-containing protein [Syntrophomonas erecta subsp. sporosyntropha]